MKSNTIYALGFFDGVHLGHAALLAACRDLAAQTGAAAGVVTFDGHPDTLVRGETPLLLNTAQDRRRLLEAAGMERIVTLPFDRALMAQPWQDFFRRLITEFSAAGLVCGSDFRFGAHGQGTAGKLAQACAQAGIPCRIVPQQTLDAVRISSTHIRSLLEQGETAAARRFLGHPHILTGTVEPGRQLGRTIGVPTANLHFPEGVLVPKYGVYACQVRLPQGEFLAVTNVGCRPTVGGHRVKAESWILDFSGDLYGQEMTLAFYEYLRPERKFPDLETLQGEIQKNAAQTRTLLADLCAGGTPLRDGSFGTSE